MRKSKLLLAAAFIPVTTGAVLYLSSDTVSVVAPGQYDLMPRGPNVECRKGYSYGSTTLKNGKCRVNWGGVVSSAINDMANSAATGFISGGRGRLG